MTIFCVYQISASCLLIWVKRRETRSQTCVELRKCAGIFLRRSSLFQLLVAEENGAPVGTVRADFSEGVWELSWTVAPNARGRGVAKQMVVLLASQIPEPIRAEVKAGNIASARIAEYVGMEFDREADGVLHYKRPPLK